MPVTRLDPAARTAAANASAPASLGASGRKLVADAIGAAAGDGKRFPDLTGGNCGVHGYEVGGAQAQLMLDLARDGVKLDPKHEVVVALVQTEDESKASLVVVDTKTHHMKEAGELDFFNAPVSDKKGNELDAFHTLFLLLKDAPELPLQNDNASWKITDFKGDGPKTLPDLQIEKPRAKAETVWVDAAGQKYLAEKMAKHAGGKFPALDAGARGTHFFEVTGQDARTLADKAGRWYDAKTDILVVALETNKENTLHPVLLKRADLGKAAGIGADFGDKLALGDLTPELLKHARELPVAGRVEGFTLAELGATKRAASQHAIGVDDVKIPVGQRTKATPFTEGTGRAQKLGGHPAHKLALHADAKALAADIEKNKESGDGSRALAFQLDPAELKSALSTKDGTTKVLFDLVLGKDMGSLDEYDNFRAKDVGRKGSFAALGKMLYANGGDDKSYRGTPERRALDKSMGAFLDRMLADKDATTVFHVQSGDAGYGYNEGLVAVNRTNGSVYALVNSWAP